MIGVLPKAARCLALATAVIIGLVVLAEPAQAYVGPGMALGALGAGIGLLMTAMSALFYMGTRWTRRLWRRATGRSLPMTERAAALHIDQLES
jgi:hypothetical protein